tara:strand:- start:243 stop:452 length:210 start_codon:yes stop_codon:yes gene_type:complete
MANEYGLDHDYFRKKLKLVVRDSKMYTPDEMFNELSRLVVVAAHQANLDVLITTKKLLKEVHNREGRRK